MKIIKILLLLLLTTSTFAQVNLDNQKGNQVRNKLIECAYTEEELKIAMELVEKSNLALDLKNKIADLLIEQYEREKRMNAQNEKLIQLGWDAENNLKKILAVEKRKKSANKWFYFALGSVATYITFEAIK